VRGFEIAIAGAGALVELQLGITDLRRAALRRSGISAPPPIPVIFLIDTGASCSWVAEMHMRSLGLEPRSWGQVHDLGSKGIAQDFNAYEVSLVVGGPATPNARRFELLIGGRSFDNQPFDGLLGRDVLNQCHLGWRGPARTLRLEYE
jgi:hypothetical protein